MSSDSYSYRRRYSKSASLGALNAAHVVTVGDASSAVVCVHSVNSANLVLSVQGRISDDGPWLAMHLMPTDDLTPGAPIAATPAITTLPTRGWRVDLQGFSQFQVIVSTYTAGSVVVATSICEEPYS